MSKEFNFAISRQPRKLATAAFSSLVLVAGLAASARADVVVTPTSMGDWAFANADVNGTVGNNPTGVGQMVTGPATPPLGIGSANLATGNGTTGGDGAEILSNTDYAGVALSSLTALSYSTYDTLNNGQQFPYLQLEIATGLTGAGQPAFDQLFFEPPYQTSSSGNPGLPDQGATAMNTWQPWNALEGGWWDNDGFCNPGSGVESLSACTSTFVDPTIVNTFGTAGVLDGVGGLQLEVGFAGAGDQFNGYVDAVTVGVSGTSTTFDFEPNSAPVPEPASLAIFGAALAGFGVLKRRRRKTA
jgi:hypothetical protein